MIVEGQVHGGLAQGIGQALLEGCVYDKETGQLLTGSYNDYAMPRADDLPWFRAVDQCDAVHAQPARRQRLRRGRGDRRAGGDHQRDRRRAEAARRAASRHAGDAREAVAHHPAAPHAARRGIGRGPMYEFNYHKPTSLDEVANLLGANEEAKLVAGGMTLVPTLKLRLAKPVGSGRSRRDPVVARHHRRRRRGRDRRDDPACRGQPLAGRQAGRSRPSRRWRA